MHYSVNAAEPHLLTRPGQKDTRKAAIVIRLVTESRRTPSGAKQCLLLDDDRVGGDMAHATKAFSGTFSPTPDYEAVVEATYQATVARWLSVQPFFQYIFHPGGNALDPDNPNVAIKNATVVGLRIALML